MKKAERERERKGGGARRRRTIREDMVTQMYTNT